MFGSGEFSCEGVGYVTDISSSLCSLSSMVPSFRWPPRFTMIMAAQSLRPSICTFPDTSAIVAFYLRSLAAVIYTFADNTLGCALGFEN